MMKYALAPRHRSRFRHFVRQDPLLIFDFDGALAPIVNQPEDALIPATTRDLLLDVSRRFACAVVSGRARDDLATKLSGIPFRSIVGNHGGEWLPPLEEEKPALLTVARWCFRLRRDPTLRRVDIEDKGLSLTLHYRNVRWDAPAAARAACELAGARVVRGKFCVNAIPANLPEKGMAVRRLREQLGHRFALYVGDDETDEAVFASRDPGLLTIRVGWRRRTDAEFFLHSECQMDDLLRLLLNPEAA